MKKIDVWTSLNSIAFFPLEASWIIYSQTIRNLIGK